MIKRRIVMGLLVLGTVGGFAMGFKSLRGGCHAQRSHRAHWEDRVADVCVRAAKNVDAKAPGAEGSTR